MGRIVARVSVNGAAPLEIVCGAGRQTVLWLALAAAERQRLERTPHGRVRQREGKGMERGTFGPVDVTLEGRSIHPMVTVREVLGNVRDGDFDSHSLLAAGVPISRRTAEESKGRAAGEDSGSGDEDAAQDARRGHARLGGFPDLERLALEYEGSDEGSGGEGKDARRHATHLEDDESLATMAAAATTTTKRKRKKRAHVAAEVVFHVQLTTVMECHTTGEPLQQHTAWRDVAFGHSEASQQRLEQLEQKRENRLREEREATLRARDLENRKWLAEAVGGTVDPNDPGIVHFYTDNEDLGSTAIADWRVLRDKLEKLVHYDLTELSRVRRAVLLHYRLLRNAFKFYSGMGNDRMGDMSLSELMCLLQDTQVCEPKDSELVQRLVQVVVSADGANHPVAAPPTFTAAGRGLSGRRLVDLDDGVSTSALNGRRQSISVELQLNRLQFLESILRIFLSEELYRLHQARIGIFNEDGGSIACASERFEDFMRTYIAPELERKTKSRAVRNAMQNQELIGMLALCGPRLRRLFSLVATEGELLLRRDRRVSRRRGGNATVAAGAQITSAANQRRRRREKPPGLTCKSFVLLLQLAGFVSTSSADGTKDRRFQAWERELAERGSPAQGILGGHTTRRALQTLTAADAKSLFSAAQVEDEDDEGDREESQELNFKEFLESIVRLGILLFEASDEEGKIDVQDRAAFVVNELLRCSEIL